MIDFSKYDFNKVKTEDIIIFIDGERMNELEYYNNRSIWKKICNPFFPPKMPKKYYFKASIKQIKEKK